MIKLNCSLVLALSIFVATGAAASMLETGATYQMMADSDLKSYSMNVDGVEVTVSASDDWSTYAVDFGEQVKLETVSTQTLSAMDAGDGRRWIVGGAYGIDKMYYMNAKTNSVTLDKVAWDDFTPANITFSRWQGPPTSAPIPEPISAVLFPLGEPDAD